jgi:transcriptional regulator with XRE-family HTH domain
MFDKRYKAVDVVRGTKIGASVISRYLSGMNQPSRDNFLALGKFLEVTPEWLLNSPDAPESIQKGHGTREDTEQLQKIIEVQGALIDNLQKQVKEWEDRKASIKDRYAKGREKTKNPIKPNKQKMGFLKKHKPKK